MNAEDREWVDRLDVPGSLYGPKLTVSNMRRLVALVRQEAGRADRATEDCKAMIRDLAIRRMGEATA